MSSCDWLPFGEPTISGGQSAGRIADEVAGCRGRRGIDEGVRAFGWKSAIGGSITILKRCANRSSEGVTGTPWRRPRIALIVTRGSCAPGQPCVCRRVTDSAAVVSIASTGCDTKDSLQRQDRGSRIILADKSQHLTDASSNLLMEATIYTRQAWWSIET